MRLTREFLSLSDEVYSPYTSVAREGVKTRRGTRHTERSSDCNGSGVAPNSPVATLLKYIVRPSFPREMNLTIPLGISGPTWDSFRFREYLNFQTIRLVLETSSCTNACVREVYFGNSLRLFALSPLLPNFRRTLE